MGEKVGMGHGCVDSEAGASGLIIKDRDCSSKQQWNIEASFYSDSDVQVRRIHGYKLKRSEEME